MTTSRKTRVHLIGATGYTGGDMVRLLLAHPGVELVALASRVEKPTPLSTFLPSFHSLAGRADVPTPLVEPVGNEARREEADVVVLAVPDGVAMELARSYLERGKRVLDVSGDFRIQDVAAHDAWYGGVHTDPELVPRAVYGVPELYRERIAAADLVANPGCYPTAAILALLPAVRAGLVNLESLIVDAITGVSGAGSKPSRTFHFPEINENIRAYKIAQHKHTLEIEQALADVAGQRVTVLFTPHVVPVTRGILATVYADLRANQTARQLWDVYVQAYAREPFVVVLPMGDVASTRGVNGTNFCHLSIHVDERTGRLIVISAIDNLGKGAAGQAVQNLNVMCGHPETAGLLDVGMCV